MLGKNEKMSLLLWDVNNRGPRNLHRCGEKRGDEIGYLGIIQVGIMYKVDVGVERCRLEWTRVGSQGMTTRSRAGHGERFQHV